MDCTGRGMGDTRLQGLGDFEGVESARGALDGAVEAVALSRRPHSGLAPQRCNRAHAHPPR